MIWKKKGVRDPAQNISGFGALTSREPCVAPPKCLVQPGNGGGSWRGGKPIHAILKAQGHSPLGVLAGLGFLMRGWYLHVMPVGC